MYSTGLSPFTCCLDYQPPLFPSQAAEAAVPSVQAFIQRYYRTWRRAREALVQSEGHTQRAADHHRTVAPRYVCWQKVWLSSKDLSCFGFWSCLVFFLFFFSAQLFSFVSVLPMLPDQWSVHMDLWTLALDYYLYLWILLSLAGISSLMTFASLGLPLAWYLTCLDSDLFHWAPGFWIWWVCYLIPFMAFVPVSVILM